MSKGSSPRPFSISHDEWINRWDAIFGRDLQEKLADDQSAEIDDKSIDEEKTEEK